MPPKAAPKAAPAKSALPTPEDEVELPEGLAPVPEPPFAFVLAHVVSHAFGVLVGGEEDFLRDFDPLEVLLSQLRSEAASEKANSYNVIAVEREELEGLAEGGSLAAGLRKKAEAEAAFRKRRKVNEARKRAIAVAELAAAGGEVEADREPESKKGPIDMVLMPIGYPSTSEELQELQAEGLFGIADAWVSLHLSGQTLMDEPNEPGPPVRMVKRLGAPEMLQDLRRMVLDAEHGSALAGVTVTELYDCQTWALEKAAGGEGEVAPPEGALANPAEVKQAREAILNVVVAAAVQRLHFKEWLETVPQARISIPTFPPEVKEEKKGEHPLPGDEQPEEKEKPAAPVIDTTLYQRLAGSVDQSHHDVPLLLHCLVEQVALNLRGDSKDVADELVTKEAKEHAQDELLSELQQVNDFLDGAGELLLFGDDAPRKKVEQGQAKKKAGSLIDMLDKEQQEADGHAQQEEEVYIPGMGPPPALGLPQEPEHLADDLIISYQDRSSCRHVGDTLPGGKSVCDEIDRLLSHLWGPGIRRTGMPKTPSMKASARSAHRNRIYKFMPSLSVVELERLVLLKEFESLLNDAQPERTWDLKDRVYHEKIQVQMLCQALMAASRQEFFVNTRYVERQDCLLVAMHHRALPGRVLWHSWEGDLLTLMASKDESKKEDEEEKDEEEEVLDDSEKAEVSKEVEEVRLCPLPTFNDWWQVMSGSPSEAPPVPSAVASTAGSRAGSKVTGSRANSKTEQASSRGVSKTSKTSEQPEGSEAPPPLGAHLAELKLPAAPTKVLNLDARDVGFCKVVEKILVPSDNSVILRTALQRGVCDIIPELTTDGEAVPVEAPKDDEGEQAAAETDEEPDSDEEKEAKREDFAPKPRRELRSVRVLKDGLTFGMVSDQAWQGKADAARKIREEREAAEAAAAVPEEEGDDAEAIRAAQGIPSPDEEAGAAEDDPDATMVQDKVPDQEEDDDEDGEAANIAERRLEDTQFGRLWIAFQDGARCSVRMEHERCWYMEGVDESWDVNDSRPGTQVTYTPPSGLVVTAYSDGSVRQNWPPQGFLSSSVATAAAEEYMPGRSEDVEMMRTITPFGLLILHRLSGRREVYHPNGTRAWRNPLLQEVEARRDHFRAEATKKGCDASAPALARRLDRIYIAYEEFLAEEDPMDPSEVWKSLGMAGHWRITTRNGRRFGRCETPQEVRAASKTTTAAGSAPVGSQAGSKLGSAEPSPRPEEDAVPPPDAEPEEADEESEAEHEEPPPELKEILEAVLVDDGDNLEYELDPAGLFTQVDPHTGMNLISNDEGMLILTSPDGKSNTCLLADGTHVSYCQVKDGSEVVFEKEASIRVACHIHQKAYTPALVVKVHCEDGTSLEIMPRRLNLKGELERANPYTFLMKLKQEELEEPGSPNAAALLEAAAGSTSGNNVSGHALCRNSDPRKDDFSTNASVLLRRVEGTVINSKGAGEVEIIGCLDVSALGEEKALKTSQDRGNVYTAQVDYNRITMRDDDGNAYEVKGDQTLDFKLSVSMGDDFSSPRCTRPKMPFQHPDASFLPLPEQAPAPRLFVVYGDGEAEELLATRDVEEALRLARQDSNAMVFENESMGWPMDNCLSSSIHRILDMDPVTLPVRPIQLPDNVAGKAEIPGHPRTFTEFRQFIRYPAITEQNRQAWEAALANYAEQEEESRRRLEALGAGLQAKKAEVPAPGAGYGGNGQVMLTEASDQAKDGGA